MLLEELLGSLGMASFEQGTMERCVYLAALWLPLLGQRGQSISEGQIIQLADGDIETLRVSVADAR